MHVPFTGGRPAGTQYGPCVALPPHHPQPKLKQPSVYARLHSEANVSKGTNADEQYSRFVLGSKSQRHTVSGQSADVNAVSQEVQEDWFDPCITHFPSASHHVQSGVSEHADEVTIDSQCSIHEGFASTAEVQ